MTSRTALLTFYYVCGLLGLVWHFAIIFGFEATTTYPLLVHSVYATLATGLTLTCIVAARKLLVWLTR
ncbi:MAG: hypothetical protein ABL907_25640 [Hyphomicrobium sp.]